MDAIGAERKGGPRELQPSFQATIPREKVRGITADIRLQADTPDEASRGFTHDHHAGRKRRCPEREVNESDEPCSLYG
jgi:hypothetical protein